MSPDDNIKQLIFSSITRPKSQNLNEEAMRRSSSRGKMDLLFSLFSYFPWFLDKEKC